MEIAKVGMESMIALGIGAVLGIGVPLGIAIWWLVTRKESFITFLVGVITFCVFVFVLEKPIQNALILPDHAVSRFINARPILWGFVVGLFPGVFEETGRFVAFKTVLKKHRNKRTAITYGIGHGGIEMMLLFGLTYITYLSYAVMMNTGTMGLVIEQVTTQAPEQLDVLQQVMDVIAGYSFVDLSLGLMERVFAFLFHVGASMLVFYACRERRKFFFYPLMILIHTAMDMICGLYLNGTLQISQAALEVIVVIFGTVVFLGAHMIYKYDQTRFIIE
jgi:uncharacterized membrane protein YhfC